MESDWHTRGWTQLLKSSHAIMKRVVHDSGVKLGYHNVVNRRAMTLSRKCRLSQPIIEVEDVPGSNARAALPAMPRRKGLQRARVAATRGCPCLFIPPCVAGDNLDGGG